MFMMLCLVLSLAARVQAGYIYTTLTPPDSSDSSAFGINDQGNVVGSYKNPTGTSQYGFVLSNGVYTPISYLPPPFFGTIVTGVNNAGSMVGYYNHLITGSTGGFELSGGTFTPLDVPGSMSTVATGINSLGQVVGIYENSVGQYGFLWNGSTYTAIAVPNVASVGGINDKGDIVGSYIASDGANHGFLLSGGTYTTISFPGSGSTTATGINQLGQIVGSYVDAAGNDHGFLYSGGTYTTFDVPGGQSTDPFGINAQGDIVGVYSGGAFLATSVPEPASLISLASGLGIIITATFLARGRMSGGRR
jgi:probable HAF family extracellular repeat protein